MAAVPFVNLASHKPSHIVNTQYNMFCVVPKYYTDLNGVVILQIY